MTDRRPTWESTWLDVACAVARRSLCVNSQVGAVLVSADNYVVSTGYNGPPPGFPAGGRQCSEWCPRSMSGIGSGTQDYSACESLHAEENAIVRAAYREAQGGTLYVTRLPCLPCARRAAAAGVARVVYGYDPSDSPGRAAGVGALMARASVVLQMESEAEREVKA